MGDMRFRGQLLQECSDQDLYDAWTFSQERPVELYGPDGKLLSVSERHAAYLDIEGQITMEMVARGLRPASAQAGQESDGVKPNE